MSGWGQEVGFPDLSAVMKEMMREGEKEGQRDIPVILVVTGDSL